MPINKYAPKAASSIIHVCVYIYIIPKSYTIQLKKFGRVWDKKKPKLL